MIDPEKYRVGPDATIVEADLDAEPAVVGGRELREADAEALAEATLAEIRRRNLVPGRKSLARDGSHSPRVQFRVPDEVLAQAEARAAAQGVSLSRLAREALERYLAS